MYENNLVDTFKGTARDGVGPQLRGMARHSEVRLRTRLPGEAQAEASRGFSQHHAAAGGGAGLEIAGRAAAGAWWSQGSEGGSTRAARGRPRDGSHVEYRDPGTWTVEESEPDSQDLGPGGETQDGEPPPANCPTRLAARPSPPPWRAVGRRGRPAGRRGAADMPGRAAVQVPPPTSTQRRRFPSRAHGQRGVRPTPAPLYAKARTQRYLKSGFPTGRRRGRARDARGRAHGHRNPPAHRRLCSLPNVTESFSEQVRPTLSRSRKTTRATGLN